MRIQLGLPHQRADSVLGKRLATLTLVRLIFLSALLGTLGRWHLRDIQLRAFSVQVALITLAVAFGLAGAYALILRRGTHYKKLAYAQIIFDQLTWTVFVYLTGGAGSGATSLYGLTVLTGAVVGGLTAATVAAITGFVLYVILSILLMSGWLRVPPDQSDVFYTVTLEQSASPMALNLLVIVVVTLLAGYLTERLRLTGGKLKEATERALQAERLAYLGKVSAGLAHEIRNPLGSISASIEMLREVPGLSEDDRQLCSIIHSESRRLNDLVGDMLDLARPQKPTMTIVQVEAVAKEVVILARRSGRSTNDVNVELKTSSPDQSSMVRADPAQFRQLLWNLVRNAVQATRPETTVTIRVQTVDSKQVHVEVQDQGKGIGEDVKPHLFEAFFSARMHGSGIGLAVVKRIADDHGWGLQVESKLDEGTVFRLSLPLEK